MTAPTMRSRILLLFLFSAHLALSQSGDTPGLLATYGDGGTRLRMVVAAPQFYLAPEESAHPALGKSFEAEWTGLLSIARAGEYTFDGGQAILSIDGRVVGSQPLALTAGRHA